MTRLKTIKGVSYSESKTQDFTSEALRGIENKSPFLNGNTVTKTIGTGDTQVSHGLGKNYQGWIVTKQTTAGVVFESPTENKNQDRIIILRASLSVTATMIIF